MSHVPGESGSSGTSNWASSTQSSSPASSPSMCVAAQPCQRAIQRGRSSVTHTRNAARKYSVASATLNNQSSRRRAKHEITWRRRQRRREPHGCSITNRLEKLVQRGRRIRFTNLHLLQPRHEITDRILFSLIWPLETQLQREVVTQARRRHKFVFTTTRLTRDRHIVSGAVAITEHHVQLEIRIGR